MFERVMQQHDSESSRRILQRERLKMTRTRRLALLLILLSSGFSILWVFFLNPTLPSWMGDFKGIYFDTRCLLQHDDPYKEGEPLHVYQAEEGEIPQSLQGFRQVLARDVYLPTAFIFIAPFAMLPWKSACLLWMIVTVGSLTLAAFLIWNSAANRAPILACVLICFVLANSEILFGTGNTAGIVVSLCMVAVWCFFKKRFAPVGIFCLAISLAIKPHDAGLVWLYFLLVGGIYRKRALQTLALTVVLALPGILWVTQVTPNWMQEMHSNLVVASAPGGLSNPGLASINGRSASMVIDLQAAISIFRDDPRFYNPVSYTICGILLLIWSVCTLKLRFTQRRAWLALAAVVPLTLLVTYHRPYDAKLLMLTVPACAMLWAEGGAIRWIALVVSTAGLVLTGDIPLALFSVIGNNLHMNTTGICDQMLMVVLLRPASLIMLVMGTFYLWAYVWHTAPDSENGMSQIISTDSVPAIKQV
jgi:hypothetical protein